MIELSSENYGYLLEIVLTASFILVNRLLLFQLTTDSVAVTMTNDTSFGARIFHCLSYPFIS